MPNTPAIQLDILELIKSGSHYSEKRGGQLHIIEARTGQTQYILSANAYDIVPTLVEHTLADGTKVYVQEALKPTVTHVRDTLFSPIIIDELCTRIVHGESITDICGQPGMPTYGALSRWRREHPWVEEALDRARRDRAEVYRDRAMHEANQARSSKDPLGASALKIETMKWAAAVDRPEVYSPKAKIEATVNMPTQILINTGITRDVTPKPEEITDDKGS